MALARYAVEKLHGPDPVSSLLNDAPFGNEVALRLPRPAEEVVQALAASVTWPPVILWGGAPMRAWMMCS